MVPSDASIEPEEKPRQTVRNDRALCLWSKVAVRAVSMISQRV